MLQTSIYIIITAREVNTMLDEFVKLINTLGFPITVSLYLLFKINVQIVSLTQSIQDLKKEIAAVIKNQNCE